LVRVANEQRLAGYTGARLFEFNDKTSRLVRFAQESGTLPVSKLFDRYNLLIELISPKDVGRLPVSELSLNLRISMLGRRPQDSGIVPSKEFESKYKYLIADNLLRPEGMVPVRELVPKFNFVRETMFSIDEGMLPMSAFVDSSIAFTTPPLHTIPSQTLTHLFAAPTQFQAGDV
jgi:hypothetical protein